MRKFAVCIRGMNFLLKREDIPRKESFWAARYVEAPDMSSATEKTMELLRSELDLEVLNKKSDPPDVNVQEVSEVYFYEDTMLVEGKSIPVEGFLWDEIEEEEDEQVNLSGGLGGIVSEVKQKDFHIHSICIHFTNALYPVAVFFIFLFLITGNESFDKTYFYIMVLATLSVPFSYASGVIEWRRRYQGAMIDIFFKKFRFGVVVFLLGSAATLWRYFSPEVLNGGGIKVALFVLLNLLILPLIVYLGHVGGKIVYEGLEERVRSGSGGLL